MKGTTPPIATYRLQLSPEFGFASALDTVPYLRDLGVSHLYLSPVFEACPGSTHGYDQTDPTRVRAELGGEAGLGALVGGARRAGLGILLDIVPNHMAAHHANPWWWGLLRDGPESRFARFFDVDWDHAGGKIVLPVLGGTLDDALNAGELTMERGDSGSECLCYFDRRFPLRESSSASSDIRRVLDDQHFKLMYWRDGLQHLNYRRFFDISDLVGVRMEDPLVFDELHAGVLRLVARGWIDGLRIDHVDGLADPLAYLRRLRSQIDAAAPRGHPVFVLVEKILARNESLPEAWPIDGTTGYEFAAAATALGIDLAGLGRLRDHGIRTGAAPRNFEEARLAAKVEVAEHLLAPELTRLTELAAVALAAFGPTPDGRALRDALVAISSHLDVYRTYADDDGISEQEADRIRGAAARAGRSLTGADEGSALAALEAAMTLSGPCATGPARDSALRLLRGWQQFTGPLAAKGVEDTALYRDMTLPALNAVGSEPVERDAGAELRRLIHDRDSAHRGSLNATATHDTKRGEDTRARMAALSHSTRETIDALDAVRRAVAGALAPADERLLAYTLIALIPLDGPYDPHLAPRLKAYLRKAARESKLRTSWLNPDSTYETAADDAVEFLLNNTRAEDVRESLRLAARVSRRRAAVGSLASVLLKTLAPGVPDFYQGCELLDLSLVDPDNRRPVDWESRQTMLERLRIEWPASPTALAARVLADPDSDRAKLFITWRALALRRWLFQEGLTPVITGLQLSSDRRSWEVACGDRRCRVEIHLTPGTRAVPLRGCIDQLSGRSIEVGADPWIAAAAATGKGDVRALL